MKNRFYLVVFFLLFSVVKISGQTTYEGPNGSSVTVTRPNLSSSNNSSSGSNNNNSSISSSRNNSSNSSYSIYKSKEQIKREYQEAEERMADMIRERNRIEQNRLEEEKNKQVEAFVPVKQELLANMKRPPSMEFVPVLNKDMQTVLSNQSQNVRTSGYPYNSIEEWFNALKRNLADFVSPETNEIELFLANYDMSWDEFYNKFKDKLQEIFQGKTKDEIYEIVMSGSSLNKVKKYVDLYYAR